jgi:recombination protein RecT
MSEFKPYEENLALPVKTAANYIRLLETYKGKLKELLPKTAGVSITVVLSAAIEAVSAKATLRACTAASHLKAIKVSCELGLPVSPTLGWASIIHYKNQAQFQIQYKGWEELVYRATPVKMLDTKLVFKGDRIEIHKGTNPHIDHVSDLTADRSDENIIGAYSVAHFGGDTPPRFEDMNLSEIKKIRQRSKSAHKGPWVTDFGEMTKKTPLLRLIKHLPKSRESRMMEVALQTEYDLTGLATLSGGNEDTNPEGRLNALQRRINERRRRAAGLEPQADASRGDGPAPTASTQPMNAQPAEGPNRKADLHKERDREALPGETLPPARQRPPEDKNRTQSGPPAQADPPRERRARSKPQSGGDPWEEFLPENPNE